MPIGKGVAWPFTVFLGLVALLLMLAGIGPGYVLLLTVGLALLMWGLTRREKPAGESSSCAVSCCHFLGQDPGDSEGERGNTGNTTFQEK
jgi:hypothetical protein